MAGGVAHCHRIIPRIGLRHLGQGQRRGGRPFNRLAVLAPLIGQRLAASRRDTQLNTLPLDERERFGQLRDLRRQQNDQLGHFTDSRAALVLHEDVVVPRVHSLHLGQAQGALRAALDQLAIVIPKISDRLGALDHHLQHHGVPEDGGGSLRLRHNPDRRDNRDHHDSRLRLASGVAHHHRIVPCIG